MRLKGEDDNNKESWMFGIIGLCFGCSDVCVCLCVSETMGFVVTQLGFESDTMIFFVFDFRFGTWFLFKIVIWYG